MLLHNSLHVHYIIYYMLIYMILHVITRLLLLLHAYYRQTISFIEILNRGRHPALGKWRLPRHAGRTHAYSLAV